MKERRINGKTLAEIDNELRDEFEPSSYKKHEGNKYYYVPGECYINRFDQVVGSLNYSFELSDLQMTQNSMQQNFIVIGKITIFDDDGNIVTAKSAAGGAEICYSNDNETRPVNLPNETIDVTKNAFVHCAKVMFGVGGNKLNDMNSKIRSGKKNYPNNSSDKNKNPNNSSNSKNVVPNTQYVYNESQYLEITIKSPFTSNSKGGYFCNSEENGIPYRFIIWQDGMAKIEKTCEREKFFNCYKQDTKLKLYGHFVYFNNNTQIWFDDTYSSKAAEGK